MTVSCSTKVCSFGNQVVEKIEVIFFVDFLFIFNKKLFQTEHSRYENGRYVYRIENSPMCEYMITFINNLKQLPEESLKNSVLENFSVLQVRFFLGIEFLNFVFFLFQLVKNHDTQELLLSLAYVFEVSTSEHGAQHVIYRLTNKCNFWSLFFINK